MFNENELTEFNNKIQALLGDSSASKEEKIHALEDVRHDLLERQRATEENMGPKSARDTGKIGEQLQRVTRALTAVRGSKSGSS